MDLDELISRLGVALGIGLLIGLERGWRRRGAAAGSRAAGIRTFALSGLLGGVIAALALALPRQAAGGAATLAIVLGVAFAAYSAVIALFTRDENQAAGHFSATTAIAGMLTFALGAYALLGDMRVAAGAAVASAVMFLRVVGIVAALKVELLVLVAPALIAAALTALGFAVAWMIWQHADRDEYRSVRFRNPFDLLSVVGFAVFLAVIIVLGRAVGEAFGATGAVAGAIVVGLVDVDAVTVSMLRLLAVLASGCLAVGGAAAWLTLAYLAP
jgi:uncharacterized membrane protein (DUF4010 family)